MNYWKKVILVFIVAVAGFSTKAANTEAIDSLFDELKAVEHDTAKVRLLNEISSHYLKSDLFRSQEYAKQALELARDIDHVPGMARAYEMQGYGEFYHKRYTEGLNKFLQALKKFEQLSNMNGQSRVLNNIGLIYYNIDQYEKALEYHKQALRIEQGSGDSTGMAVSFNNIAMIYMLRTNTDSALLYLEKTKDLYIGLNDINGLGGVYANLASFYSNEGKHSDALQMLENAKKYHEQAGNKKGMAHDYANMGRTHLYSGNHYEAIKAYADAMEITINLPDPSLLATIFEGLARSYAKNGNYKEAYYAQQRYTDLKDSLFFEETQQQIAAVEMKYETRLKDAQIKAKTGELEREKMRRMAAIKEQESKVKAEQVGGGLFIALIAGLVIIIVGLIGLVFYYRHQSK